MNRLKGKTIFVAGGGGIGTSLARRFAQEGANVLLGDIAVEPARAACTEITAAGGRALAVPLDGADERSIAAAIRLACENFGGLDGMHVNFATFVDSDFDTGILDLPLETFDETIRVNLRGYYLCTRAALPAIVERGGGSIVYTSSPASVKGEPTRVAYAVAKAGVEALMRHVAARYGATGVRANCIAPGSTLHERLERELDDATKQWCLDMAAIKSRLGRPDDIAAMSALLMSDEGSYITGQVIGVDGGVILRR
ncbi:MAG TPA: SDR family NAD(P)-dependent oxidoreductase [Steroidobacteraceae bacterium]|jgi:NAD(P)-dependent dehydrogenase (short-subunit alcohol dehydrogenase family)|nr:SDR family NAD(P)-dependent oxidoreductase [Steroidobacteraceae bacterium]